MCANHHAEKRIVWIVIAIVGLAGFVLDPSRKVGKASAGTAAAAISSVSR